MSEIDFNGQVAAITGSGRGIGREYALLLASRGAKVLVNDLGAQIDGTGHDASVASEVVEEIRKAGGQAVSNSSDIGTREGAAAVIDATLNAFGRIDILIHNAGTQHHASFSEIDLDAAERVIFTHLLGGMYLAHRAWPHMVAQKYGRILLTTSTAMFGAVKTTAYSAAKSGVLGLTRSLALEGKQLNLDIKVNAIAPSALTRRVKLTRLGDPAGTALDEQFGEKLHPRHVAPIAAYLVSRQCQLTGDCLRGGGNIIGKIFTGLTQGWNPEGADISIEDVEAHLGEATDQRNYQVRVTSTYPRTRRSLGSVP